jgi:hypothetical protein
LLDRLSDLRGPWRPRPQVVLVEPDLEASLLRLGRGLQPALECPRRLRIGTGMAEENERQTIYRLKDDPAWAEGVLATWAA